MWLMEIPFYKDLCLFIFTLIYCCTSKYFMFKEYGIVALAQKKCLIDLEYITGIFDFIIVTKSKLKSMRENNEEWKLWE